MKFMDIQTQQWLHIISSLYKKHSALQHFDKETDSIVA